MSNLWVNWRFWYWHLQIGPDWPWVTFSRDTLRWHCGWCSPWFERY
jgi:hypothetical protein